MNKKEIFFAFIKTIEEKNMLTKFIINIFDYKDFHDYNYLFRMIKDEDKIIIDIYDNVSDNRFNRYIFDFGMSKRKTETIKEGNVFVNYINISKQNDSSNKLYKLAYLTKLNKNIIEYASTFLEKEFVSILNNITKNKSISL